MLYYSMLCTQTVGVYCILHFLRDNINIILFVMIITVEYILIFNVQIPEYNIMRRLM